MTEPDTPNNDYNPPTSDEVRRLLKALELTGAEAGALLDVNSRQIRRYTSGDSIMTYTVLYTLLGRTRRADVTPANWRSELWLD